MENPHGDTLSAETVKRHIDSVMSFFSAMNAADFNTIEGLIGKNLVRFGPYDHEDDVVRGGVNYLSYLKRTVVAAPGEYRPDIKDVTHALSRPRVYAEYIERFKKEGADGDAVEISLVLVVDFTVDDKIEGLTVYWRSSKENAFPMAAQSWYDPTNWVDH